MYLFTEMVGGAGKKDKSITDQGSDFTVLFTFFNCCFLRQNVKSALSEELFFHPNQYLNTKVGSILKGSVFNWPISYDVLCKKNLQLNRNINSPPNV